MNKPPEPKWAGIERTILNGLKWVVLVFGLMPLLMGIAIYIIATLFRVELPFLTIYGLGILFGGLPFLGWAEKSKRLYRVVGSQRVVIVTYDIPDTSSREASDSREETSHNAVKLGEGFHILDPFDQEYVDLAIEIDYQVPVSDFRITLGDKGGLDLVVKGAIATFRTNSEETLLLARISTSESERSQRITDNMKEYVQRYIETSFRENFTDADQNVMNKLEDISRSVEEKLTAMLESKGWGLHLKSFTLGNVDVPQAVEAARNEYAVMEQLRHASVQLAAEHNKGLDPSDPRRLTPQQALDLTLIAVGRKQTKREEAVNDNSYKVDPATLSVLKEVFTDTLKALKTATPASTPTTPTS